MNPESTTRDASSLTTQELEFPKQGYSRNRATDIICLMGVSIVVALFGLWNGPGLGDHEAIVALGARGIRDTGEWMVPKVNDEEFLRKPPLAFWTAAAASYITGTDASAPPVNEAAARLPSAIAAILTTAVVYILGKSMFGHGVAIIAALVFACCTGTFYFSHNAQVEMQLTLFMTASYASFWIATESPKRNRWAAVAFYVALALAMLAKAPLPIALVLLPLALWWLVLIPLLRLTHEPDDGIADAQASRWSIFRNQVVRIWDISPILGIAVFLLIFLPWPLYIAWKHPSTLELWRIEYLARYTGDLSDMDRPFWYYLPIALALMLPFSLTLPEAVASPFLSAYRRHRRPLIFLLTMFVVPLVFLSTAAFKRPHYLVGCIPAMALLLGPPLHRLFVEKRVFQRKVLYALSATLVLAVVVGVVVGLRHLGDRYENDTDLMLPAGIVVCLGIAISVALFLTRRRLAALLCLIAMMCATYSLAWGALGTENILDSRVNNMIDQLRAHGITPANRLIWLSGRPDSRLTYYYGIPTERLYTAMELAPVRKGRSSVSADLIEKTVEGIREILQQKEGTYFVVKGRYWDQFVQGADLPVEIVFRIDADSDEPDGDDWVVFQSAHG